YCGVAAETTKQPDQYGRVGGVATPPLETVTLTSADRLQLSPGPKSGLVQKSGCQGNRLCHGCVSRVGRNPRRHWRFHSRLAQPWHLRVLPCFEPCPIRPGSEEWVSGEQFLPPLCPACLA